MKLSDSDFQRLCGVRPNSIPKRSERIIEEYITKYDLCETEIDFQFINGFAYAVTIIREMLRAESEEYNDNK